MRIRHVTHAGLLVDTPAGALLTDPYWMLDAWERSVAVLFPPRRVEWRAWKAPRWTFLSHEHTDHAHPPTLRALRDAGLLRTVLIPARRPALRELLERERIPDVVELPHLKPVDLAPGVAAMAVLHPNGVDSTLLFRARGRSLAACSDCFLPPDLAEAAARWTPLDVAFVPHTSAQDLYPFVLDLPRDRLRSLALEREATETARLHAHAAILGARITVPYAYAIAYRHADQQHLNDDGHTLPEEFARSFEALHPGRGTRVTWPGDVIDVATGHVRRARRPAGMDGTRDGFLASVRAHLAAHPPDPWDDGDPALAAPFLVRHFTRAALASPALAPLRGSSIRLVVRGRHGDTSWTLPVGGPRIQEGATTDPILVVTMPASLVPPLLAGTHDPFMALYTYRVRFRWTRDVLPTPRAAADAAIDLFVRLFTPRRLWL